MKKADINNKNKEKLTINPMLPNKKIHKKSKHKIKKPSLYKVLIHNDNYTTMEFVVQILMQIFDKTFDEAVHLMCTIHQQGQGIAGTYSYDIALSKMEQIQISAQKNQYPLKVSLEEV